MPVKLVDKEIGDTGFGMMGMTWREKPQPYSESIKTLKAALENGSNFWNGGELYGTPDSNSLHLLHEYFQQNPDDANKVVISIKGGLLPGQMKPDGSEKNIRRSVDECNRVLAGTKKLDIFECARKDPNVEIEDIVKVLADLIKEGKMSGISLSEVGAQTIRRAAKVHKIEAVEVEFSLFCTEILENGVAEACAEHQIPIIAYSPLGRGFLTGEIKTIEDVQKLGDGRTHMPRFQPGNFEQNLKLVSEVEKLAKKKSCSPGQVAIAWVKAHSGKGGLPTIIPIPGATKVNRVLENNKDIELSDSDLRELDQIVKSVTIAGGRYPEAVDALSWA